jgi:tetratricopeptide (TPR) repeat protein
MSPEQVRGEDLDARTDVFSLGVVLYEMATGKQPFKGTATGVIFDEILHKAPTSPVRINPDMPDEMERIINRALEKDREVRYQSAKDLLAELKRLRRDSISRVTPVVDTAVPKRRRGMQWGLVALTVVALATVGLLAIWYSGAFQPERTEAPRSLADDFCDRGFNYMTRHRVEDIEAAIDQFNRALKVDPQSARAHAGLASAYSTRVIMFGYPGDWLDTAIEEANVALKLDPDLPEAHRVLAIAYQRKGLYVRAQQALDKTIQLYPDDDRTLYQAGWISFFQGRVDEAYGNFRKALQLNPRSLSHSNSVGYVYISLNEYDKAEDWIQKALVIQGDDLFALDSLCLVYLLEDRLDKLKEKADHLVDLAPGIIFGWWRLGLHAYHSSDCEAARKYFEQANQISPFGRRLALGPIFLAHAYLKLGNQDEGQKHLDLSRRHVDVRLAAGDEGYEPSRGWT